MAILLQRYDCFDIVFATGPEEEEVRHGMSMDSRCKEIFYGLRPGSHQPGMGGLGTSPRDAGCNEKKNRGFMQGDPYLP